MKTKLLLAFGPLLATTFIFGTLAFGLLLDNYNPIAQTVSEIGEEGSPFYKAWQFFSTTIGSLILLFAFGLIIFAKKMKLAVMPAVLVLFYGISQIGIGSFPAPHQLHNLFGLSMTLGYLAPLFFAVKWKNSLHIRFKQVSIFAFIVVMLGIVLNLSPAFAPKLYPLSYYGIVQRLLLFSFYLYLGYLGWHSYRNWMKIAL